MSERPSLPSPASSPSLGSDLRLLLASPRELWLTCLAVVIEYIGAFSFLQTLPLWLSSDFGMTDTQAGDWAGYWSMGLTLMVFFAGSLADSFGIRRTVIVAHGGAAVCRLLLALVHTRALAAVVLALYAVSFATTLPVVQAALHRFSTPRTRTLAFSLYYLSGAIGGLLTGPLLDVTRKHFLDPSTHALAARSVALPLLGPHTMTAHAAVLGAGAVTSLGAFVVVLFWRKGAEDRDLEGETQAPRTRQTPFALLRAVVGEPIFWRFLLLMLLLSIVKVVFQHMQFTWPKYVLRVEGDDFPAGEVWALNSALILVFTPLATVLTRRWRALDAIIVGAFFTAAAPLLLCAGSSMPFQIAMVVTITIGEALWSPRALEYNVAIAPRGQESTYVGLASFPYFLAKLVAARTSGRLLERFCPASGPRRPEMLWAVIGVSTLIAPVAILLLRRVIERGSARASPAEALS